jgi:PAS domain S-box-containing protein
MPRNDHKKSPSAGTTEDCKKIFSMLIDAANDAIFIADAETGLIISANKKAEEMLGIPLHDIVGTHLTSLHPSEESAVYGAIYEKYSQRGNGISDNLLIVNSSGHRVPVEISISVTELKGRKFIQGIFRDITERKKAEEELRHHKIQLEESVKTRTQQLVEANENLQKEIRVRRTVENRLLDYHKQLKSLTSQMSLIEEREKRRIATELHDCIGQTLALAKIKLGLLNKLAPSPELKSSAKEILHLIEQTIKETRTLTFELSPPILYELGFEHAIKWLIDQIYEKYGIRTTLIDDGSEKPFDSNIRFFLFQAVRELMINIAKHAQSDSARITLSRIKNRLKICVTDYGTGFSETTSQTSGFGLFNIRERMNHINGKFSLSSVPGEGTVVTLEAPLDLKK